MRSVLLTWDSFKSHKSNCSALQAKTCVLNSRGASLNSRGTSLNSRGTSLNSRGASLNRPMSTFTFTAPSALPPQVSTIPHLYYLLLCRKEATKDAYNFRGNLIRGTKKKPQFLIHQSQFNVVPFPEEFGTRLNARNVYLQRLDAIYYKRQKTLINTDVFLLRE